MTPRHFLRRAGERLRDWTIDETWVVGVAERPIASFLHDQSLDGVRWIEAPAGVYYADPFGVPDEAVIFCERLDLHDGIGRLVALDLAPDGGVREHPTGLRVDGHASYPFMLGEGNRILCLPETVSDGALTLWCRGPRGRWGVLHRIAGVAAIDPVLFMHAGRSWLAFTDGAIGADDNLCLFHAPSPDGPWTPHAANPVRRGRSGSRNGGTPFGADGALYRPAQDCSQGYGGAVVIQRIDRLDTTAFVETPAARLVPDRQGTYSAGLHTLSAWGERTLIDAKKRGFVAAGLTRRMRKRTKGAERWLQRLRPQEGRAPAAERPA